MVFCPSRLSIINPPTRRQANPAPGLPPLSITGVNSAELPPLTPYFPALYQIVVLVSQRTRPRTRTAAAGCPAAAARRPRTEAAGRDARRGAQRPRTEGVGRRPGGGGRGAAACRAAGARGGLLRACRWRVCPGRDVARPGLPRPRPAPVSSPPPALFRRPPRLSPRPTRRRPATPEASPPHPLFQRTLHPPPRHARSHPAPRPLSHTLRAAAAPPRPKPSRRRRPAPRSPRTASRRPTLPALLPAHGLAHDPHGLAPSDLPRLDVLRFPTVTGC